MLQRKIMDHLVEWKNNPSHKALLLTGARQIGKTYIIREFGKANYNNVIELNLMLNKDAKDALSAGGTTEDILLRLSLFSKTQASAKDTLIFVDEVQELPEFISEIKGLVDKSDYDFILSGSLLGVKINDLDVNPTGYVTVKKMYPMDFEEFAAAQGVGSNVLAHLSDSLTNEAEVDPAVHSYLIKLFRKYLVVGGLPDAVQTYIDTNDLALVRTVHEGIKDWYRQDITQYCKGIDALKAREAFDLVPSELNAQNKRFVLKSLNANAKFRDYEDAFLWLSNANVALPVFNVDEPTSPLLASKQRNLFKLFYCDVGLLVSCFSTRATLTVLDDSGQVNFGSIYENCIAQELRCHGYETYYLNSKKYGEVDFVIENKDGEISLIEVKSGKNYTRHRALNSILDVKNYDISSSFVLCNSNVKREGRVLYLPVYMTALFNNE